MWHRAGKAWSTLNRNNKPELLSPAGDMERLRAAVDFGADAVYLGGKEFGMRASALNFDFEDLKKAVLYAHSRQVKVYFTCNTLPTNSEMDKMGEFLKNTAACGIDAFIATDIGVLSLIKKYTPDIEVHISTQAGVVNYVTASEFYHMGAKRVVLARELSLEDIRTIREKTPSQLDIEAFVHGAMCVSFSGRCLLSSYLTHRDANRGQCAQPCRWGYHLVEEKRPGEHYPIFEDSSGTYILNAKDLCMIEHIDALVQAGITSFKLEGRAKSSYYVAVITNAYRCAIDEYLASPQNYKVSSWLLDEVKKVSHREYSTGFYFGPPDNGQYYDNGGYIRTCDIIGIVDGYENGMLTVTQKNRFSKGDPIELLQPRSRPVAFGVDELYDTEGEPLETANHPLMKLKIPCTMPVLPGSILRREKD